MKVRIITKDESVFAANITDDHLDRCRDKMNSVAVPFEKPVWVTYDRKITDGYWSRGSDSGR